MTSKEIIDIKGNILICHEACKVIFNYDTPNKLTVNNTNSTLTLSQSGNTLQYNGIDDSLKSYKFTLYNITLNYPSSHFINSYINPQWIEMIMQHQTDDKKTQLNVSVLLVPDDSKSAQNTLAYKLFDNIGKNIPDVGQSRDIPITEWYVKDVLPDDKSFYSYISPSNEFLNWIVFQNYVKMPSTFLQAFKSKVAGNVKVDTTPPTNPDGLIIFGFKDDSRPTSSGSTPATTVNAKCPSVEDIKKQIQNEAQNKTTVSAAPPAAPSTTTSAAPSASSPSVSGAAQSSGTESDKNTSFWGSWKGILVIILIVIVSLALFVFVAYYLYFKFLSGRGSQESFFDVLKGNFNSIVDGIKSFLPKSAPPTAADDYIAQIKRITDCTLLDDLYKKFTSNKNLNPQDLQKINDAYTTVLDTLCAIPNAPPLPSSAPQKPTINATQLQIPQPQIKRRVRNTTQNKKMNAIANKLARQNI